MATQDNPGATLVPTVGGTPDNKEAQLVPNSGVNTLYNYSDPTVYAPISVPTIPNVPVPSPTPVAPLPALGLLGGQSAQMGVSSNMARFIRSSLLGRKQFMTNSSFGSPGGLPKSAGQGLPVISGI